ncbi:MAG TPA: pyridoxine 5'-phosphate synthase [Thermoanaerobaculia bacterium]|jgi:pyridoxine 5-phosphate synthase|nr:pyridoxine 5'-phosphate synthase [Thermoanaerobaculia bacterium]
MHVQMRLAVNIDHIATLREARKSDEPDPVAAAVLCELAGAQGITVHLRADRRHIQDRDVELLRRTVSTHLNIEMSAAPEMLRAAQTIKPQRVTLVPERRDELTTEGGLDVVLHAGNLDKIVRALLDSAIDVSIFVDPDLEQIRQCQKIRVPRIEINTGKFTEGWTRGNWAPELEKINMAAKAARKMGLIVLAGHGLNYRNIDAIAMNEDIEELNIGHSIIARAALVGLESAVREMLHRMHHPRRLPSGAR